MCEVIFETSSIHDPELIQKEVKDSGVMRNCNKEYYFGVITDEGIFEPFNITFCEYRIGEDLLYYIKDTLEAGREVYKFSKFAIALC